jgi:N-dimethylarginine dimethylaminohydrolase
MRDGTRSEPATDTNAIDGPNAPASPAFLMCPPDYFAVSYEINAWMHVDVQPDPDRAYAEWHALARNIERAGGIVHTLDPVPGLPDMVFTTDVGLVHSGRFIPGRFRHPERRPEVGRCAAWFTAHESDVIDLPLGPADYLEGGDMTTFGGYLVGGHGFRSECAAQALLARHLGLDFLPVTLTDPCMYHMDISFRTLDERHAIIAPSAWDRASCARVERAVPEPLVLDRDEALTFCANAVVVAKTIIMPACPARVGRILERWGYEVCVSPVNEFLKAGGAAHCLCLALDGQSPSRPV